MKSFKLLLRCLTVGALALLLLIPLSMIRGVIAERAEYRAQAVQRVAAATAGEQAFVGPLRVVPWTETRQLEYTDAQGLARNRAERSSGQLLQFPQSLRIDGQLLPSERSVGLYKVPVYEWRARMKARFDSALPAADGKAVREYGTPYLVFGISDVRGLAGSPQLRADGRPLRVEAGTRWLSKRFDGLHAMLPPVSGQRVAGSDIDMELVLKGTRSLSVAPVGDDNRVHIDSAWPHPKFDGYSPRSEVGATGFKAAWDVSALASNVQAQLRGDGTPDDGRHDDSTPDDSTPDAEGGVVRGVDSLQVSLVDPIDIYTQAERASKYGILFVLLTFVGFALFELIKRLPIHPLQYLLVGLALAVFFLLLLSLSEHIAFWQAYLLSAGACIGVQFVYLSGVLRSWLRAAGFATLLTALYGVLYSLLVSEDNALLMGSLLLFGILATIMWITRKVDWYELGGSLR